MNEPTKKNIITIAGRPGSGKSTTAKSVAAHLGFGHFSSGDLFRQLGQDRGLDVLHTNLRGEKNAEVDQLVDQRLRDIGTTGDKLVIDSRTAWHWIPSSFKVFLNLDLTIAAERIIANTDEARLVSERIPHDPAKYALELQKRLASESRRYEALYGIDPFDMKNYDLVIDTAANNVEQTAAKVVQSFQSWLQQ